MKKWKPYLIIAGIAGLAYWYFQSKAKAAKAVADARAFGITPVYSGPQASGGLTRNPPKGYKTKYAYALPVGAFYTGKMDIRPAPMGAASGDNRFFAEVILANAQTDSVEIEPL